MMTMNCSEWDNASEFYYHKDKTDIIVLVQCTQRPNPTIDKVCVSNILKFNFDVYL